MDNVRQESYVSGLENKKKAYNAMCKASLFLFGVGLFSAAVSYGMAVLSGVLMPYIEAALAGLFSLFGLGKAGSVAAARMLFSSHALSGITNILVTLLTLVFPAYVFARMTHLCADDCFNIKGKCVRGTFSLFCLTHLLTMTVLLFSQGIYDFLMPAAESLSALEAAGEFDIYSFVSEIISVCIFVPIAEEFVFRGVMYTYLKRFGIAFGVVSSALVFGVAHSSPVQSIYAFTFGTVAALALELTGNLKTGIILHALNNLLTVCTEYMPLLLGDKAYEVFHCILMAVIVVFAFFGLFSFVRHDGLYDKFRQNMKEKEITPVINAGIKEILALPMALYVIIYAVTFAMTTLMV